METKENTTIDNFDFSLIASFFNRQNRQGAGGDWETRFAISLIPSFGRKVGYCFNHAFYIGGKS